MWQAIKTVKLGTGTMDALRLAISDEGMQIGKWANDIIDKQSFRIYRNETTLDLVIKSVLELGFNSGANFNQIYQSACRIGLSKCPPETGPQLRLQYHDQPKNEWLVLAMDYIIDSTGEPRMFLVGHNDRGRWLIGDFGHAEHIYGKNKLFVFAKLRRFT